MTDEALLNSLRSAVEAVPTDAALRVHLSELLIGAGKSAEAVSHLAAVLESDSANARASELMLIALGAPAPTPVADATVGAQEEENGFDWDSAEAEVADIVGPAFVQVDDDTEAPAAIADVQNSSIRLSDVGGLDDVKERLELSFLGPARNPEMRKLYGASMSGGLLMYGPPGCGKSYLAKALAGELDAAFISLQLHDVLDMYLGQSEQNLHSLFQEARRAAPCVLFIDEIDAIGQRRSQLRNSAMRTTVNQLLSELDGATSDNEGLYVVAATNHPWDVDPALRRPGRFDRLIFVPPPDHPARESIFQTHLDNRPTLNIDVRKLAKSTDGYSGADIAHICGTAAERAMADSMKSGEVRMINMADLTAAVNEVKPSVGAWFETAENVVMFGNGAGTFDEMAAYMRKNRIK